MTNESVARENTSPPPPRRPVTKVDFLLFLAELGRRIETMAAYDFERIVRSLPAIFMLHVTDDVYRCPICKVQDTHGRNCPVRMLIGSTSSERAMSADPTFPDVEKAVQL